MESVLTATVSSPQREARFVPFMYCFFFFFCLFVFVLFFHVFFCLQSSAVVISLLPLSLSSETEGRSVGSGENWPKFSKTGERVPGMQLKRRQGKRKFNAWNYCGFYNAFLLNLRKRMRQPYVLSFFKIYFYISNPIFDKIIVKWTFCVSKS